MQARRKLIVVSNRGPIAVRPRGRRAHRRAWCRRARDGARAARLTSRRHLDRKCALGRGSDGRCRGGRSTQLPPDGSRYRLRLVAHEPAAFDLYYNVVANPALWFVQHGLWQLKHDPGRDLRPAWDEGYATVNGHLPTAVVEELERDPGTAVFFHDYHLYLAPKPRPRAAARHGDCALHAHPVGRAGRHGRYCPTRSSSAIHEEPAFVRRRQLPHESVADAFLVDVRRSSASTRTTRSCRRIRSRSIRTSSRHSPQASACSSGRRSSRVAPRDADSPRRPDRSGEERPTRSGGVRARAGAPARTARPRGDARVCSTRRGRRSPSTSTSAGESRRRPRRSRHASPAPSGFGSPTTSPVDRRVQAVRRSARQRRHGRPQPRRQGGAVRERA